jgi:hypothetical protein
MDTAEKWALRRRRTSDIVLSSAGNIEHVDWATIRRSQREFLRDYCGGCRHAAEPRDERGECRLHWTDIVGECWNFERRGAA